MSSKRYTEEFKIEAVKRVTGRGHPVTDVATRIGFSRYSPYQWAKRYSATRVEKKMPGDRQQAEIPGLKAGSAA